MCYCNTSVTECYIKLRQVECKVIDRNVHWMQITCLICLPCVRYCHVIMTLSFKLSSFAKHIHYFVHYIVIKCPYCGIQKVFTFGHWCAYPNVFLFMRVTFDVLSFSQVIHRYGTFVLLHHLNLPLSGFFFFFFYVLLTVHLSITLVNDQLDAQFFYFIIHSLQSSTCFEQRRAHHQEVKLY